MADYAAEIEVRSDVEAEREEIANYDEAQDYLANGTHPAGETKAEKGDIRKRAKKGDIRKRAKKFHGWCPSLQGDSKGWTAET